MDSVTGAVQGPSSPTAARTCVMEASLPHQGLAGPCEGQTACASQHAHAGCRQHARGQPAYGPDWPPLCRAQLGERYEFADFAAKAALASLLGHLPLSLRELWVFCHSPADPDEPHLVSALLTFVTAFCHRCALACCICGGHCCFSRLRHRPQNPAPPFAAPRAPICAAAELTQQDRLAAARAIACKCVSLELRQPVQRAQRHKMRLARK